MQENSNWYWKHQPLQQDIIVPTRTIIHPCFDVFRIIDVQEIPKFIFTGVKQKSYTRASHFSERCRL